MLKRVLYEPVVLIAAAAPHAGGIVPVQGIEDEGRTKDRKDDTDQAARHLQNDEDRDRAEHDVAGIRIEADTVVHLLVVQREVDDHRDRECRQDRIDRQRSDGAAGNGRAVDEGEDAEQMRARSEEEPWVERDRRQGNDMEQRQSHGEDRRCPAPLVTEAQEPVRKIVAPLHLRHRSIQRKLGGHEKRLRLRPGPGLYPGIGSMSLSLTKAPTAFW